MSTVHLHTPKLDVTINSFGAEVTSLREASAGELLWQAGPVWPRHAPILFPIVGRMPGDVLIHNGVNFPVGQHGFARDLEFSAENISPTSATFVLRDSEATRDHFPFAFELRVDYTVEGSTLTEQFTVANPGAEPFSASLGGHPAFAWPLREGIARDAHTLEFDHDEPAAVHKLTNGLLQAERTVTPVEGRMLRLNDELFAADAIIFDQLVSRTVRYTAPGAPMITVRFDDFEELGVWSKLPGEFVCIEPWFGTTAPADFVGEYSDKPGQFRLAPGQHRTFTYSVTVEPVL